MSGEHVTLVVEPDFSEHIRARAKLGPLWVIASPQNCPVIEEVWAAGEVYDINSPTYFDAVPGRSREDSALAFIGTVDAHHPDWTTFEIIGVRSSAAIVNALLECADGHVVVETPTSLFARARHVIQEEK
jgi:hypothetical protein